MQLLRKHWKTLVAVLGGNFVYFVLLYRWLPPNFRHRRDQLDLGIVLDFWICLFVYGLLAFRYTRQK